MLMAWGPFRFTVPIYSVESIRRASQPRVSPQPVIGRLPSLHRLGPNNETISLESTFHPHHFNGGGLAQLAGVRQAVDALVPLQLVHINGAGMNIFGLWIATSIGSEETLLNTMGTPQIVTVGLEMMRYDTSPARGIAVGAVIGAGGVSLSAGVGTGGFSASIGVGF